MNSWKFTQRSVNSRSYLNSRSLQTLRGGVKKRKKKVYITPKKIKKKPKKVKLPILKYYKVDDSGKVSSLSKECETEACDAGVFMASQRDRYYYGRCYATYVIDGK